LLREKKKVERGEWRKRERCGEGGMKEDWAEKEAVGGEKDGEGKGRGEDREG
jgi:hypothetical protein